MPEILTAKQAADYLQLSRGSVVALAREGRIPAVKIFGKWRFSRRLLRRWLEDASEERALLQAMEEAAADPDNQERNPVEQVRGELGL
jgi:excisionase family DNA binding protein